MTLDIKALAKQAGGTPQAIMHSDDSLENGHLFTGNALTEFVRLVREPLETHNTMLKAALRGVIRVADRMTDEFDAAHEALGEAK